MKDRLKRPQIEGAPKFNDAINAAFDRAEAADNLSAALPLQIKEMAAGKVVSDTRPEPMDVKLTGAGGTSGSYNAVQVYPTTGGGYAVLASGWTGVAWEYNLNSTIPTASPYYVRVEWFGPTSEWRFQAGTCS